MYKKFTSCLTTIVLTSLFIFNAPSLFALGGNNSSETPDVPLPVKSYPATITDVNDNVLKAERFSFNGKLYFKAIIGKSDVSIPFEKVKKIFIRNQATTIDKNYYNTTVTLTDGQDVDMLFLNDAKLYGEATFGKFELFFRDIKTITLP